MKVQAVKNGHGVANRVEYKSWNQFKKCVTGYYNDKKTRYNIFAGDIFLSIDNGLKTWGDYRKSKKMTSELQFMVEDLNTMIGEAADAFFTYKSFKENQTIESSYVFPSLGDRLRGTYIPNKEDMELRIVGVDYAFANTTSGTKNDNTIILCMRGLWRNNHFERYVDYIEGHEASDSDGAALRAREIWEYYYGDIFVPDLRSGGETLFNLLTKPWTPQVGISRYANRGLGVYDNSWAQVIPDAKIDDLVSRTVDQNAVPAIVPFVGSTTLNSAAWAELRNQLDMNNIKFLASAQQHQEDIENSGRYFQMTTEELVNDLLPYGQTDELIQEAVNLKTEIKNGNISLSEPRSGTKDRVVILSYVNYIMSLFELHYQKLVQDEEADYNDLQLIY